MSECEKKSFEELMSELTSLVQKMESNQLPLEDLISNYEKGNILLSECKKRLAGFSKKIEVLTNDDQKNGVWSDFEPKTTRVRDSSDFSVNSDESGALF